MQNVPAKNPNNIQSTILNETHDALNEDIIKYLKQIKVK